MAIELGTDEFWQRLQDSPAHLASEVCRIDLVGLEQTLQLHAALRAWVNASHEAARIAEERLKWEETKIRAKAYLDARTNEDPQTGKAKTLATLQAEVDTLPIVQEVVERLLDQQETRAALRAMSDALEDRKDMLIQIAAKQRKELDDYR